MANGGDCYDQRSGTGDSVILALRLVAPLITPLPRLQSYDALLHEPRIPPTATPTYRGMI